MATSTSLLQLSWYNTQTLSWVPVSAGSVAGDNLVSELPPDVLNNPAFSGKVANLLVTSTELPELPVCGEFQDLIAGANVAVCLCICMYMNMYIYMHMQYIDMYI